MYIRFVIPVRDTRCRAELGFFYGAFKIFADERFLECWERCELRREIDWFNDHLDAPDAVARRFGRHGPRSGVCWFRDTAQVCIRRARYAGWLMGELGTPVAEIRSHRPGPLVWADEQQIVALAGPHVPQAF
ncbi:hypothetical protein BCF46_0536 [Litoreibacter meonggei]|uniref:Uncharacterized protein n=1 Tax=Litoreibacter meonggei TaxID=1049199 RepID=A0A497X4Z3_9RHOB|nr:hypothetical protein BCF46_0536 [Litoreibacter meonggei]